MFANVTERKRSASKQMWYREVTSQIGEKQQNQFAINDFKIQPSLALIDGAQGVNTSLRQKRLKHAAGRRFQRLS